MDDAAYHKQLKKQTKGVLLLDLPSWYFVYYQLQQTHKKKILKINVRNPFFFFVTLCIVKWKRKQKS